jgi:hypothetical protein
MRAKCLAGSQSADTLQQCDERFVARERWPDLSAPDEVIFLSTRNAYAPYYADAKPKY